MFALALSLHLLQPTLHLGVAPPLRLQVLAADDAVIAPPLVMQPRANAAPPVEPAEADVDPDAGSVAAAEVFAGFGGMVLGHGAALGLTAAAAALADQLRGSDGVVLGATLSTAVVSDLVLLPLLATTFARLAAGDFIAGSLAKAYVRALLVHGSAAVLAFIAGLLGNGGSTSVAVAVALGVIDLFAAPTAASSGLHAVSDRAGVSPAAALRTEMPAPGGLAFAR